MPAEESRLCPLLCPLHVLLTRSLASRKSFGSVRFGNAFAYVRPRKRQALAMGDSVNVRQLIVASLFAAAVLVGCAKYPLLSHLSTREHPAAIIPLDARTFR